MRIFVIRILIGAKRSTSAKSACIAALRPMIPRKEQSAAAIRAGSIAARVSGGGHRNPQPHQGVPLRAGRGARWREEGCRKGLGDDSEVSEWSQVVPDALREPGRMRGPPDM